MPKTIAIDQEGYFAFPDGLRVEDEEVGHQIMSSLSVDDNGVSWVNYNNEQILVEPFDKPMVAAQIHEENGDWKIQAPYQVFESFDPQTFCIDEWDRFHGLTNKGIPFVLSRKAQGELFNLADEFSDDSITFGGREIKTENYYVDNESVNGAQFWSDIYNEMPRPGWDMDGPHPSLNEILPQLKLLKSRVLVPGSGYGHDAAHLAEQGHIVTGIDISEVALKGARDRYGQVANLQFKKQNIFELDEKDYGQYDLVFEHTCFCAINPRRRKELIKKYSLALNDGGRLLGIFFVNPKRSGPYFGSSEWELKRLLEDRFEFFYWTRNKTSPGWRMGLELIVFAQKKEGL